MLSDPGVLQRAKEAREKRLAMEQTAPVPAEESEERQHVEQIKRLLNSHLKVHITDGRTIYGTLVCVDEHANLILDRAEEEREGVDGRRMLSSVMVPGKHIKGVWCDFTTVATP
eukprot:TRINITY_DN14248_c0_g1_i1.p2 TRINITY_DN14248_c0_g1~~TRINITY_DN14248_c0_g1_i1.p2  ORF type:complete len:114 (-),score=23.77 TRINITY_DN14248_c0_g1_i1:331-672(-)